ncbi:RNA-binding protein [Scopulibacillus darangshiensis]|uniref:RNA-binding protein n=1 Tax=Scopulibacillus darangshiensis TaxID=442528 RepID=A0A4R2PBF1_9BACL|nr:ribosome assembly RNA-binding protein YhbY [Scopulibacillus darangshiensis]TCP32317.1 RNA-binding protein [Scopulibacillus darangshiensis]
MLTNKQKRFLQREAHHLKPIFQIGKSGLHETMVHEVNAALEARELIKINLLQNTMEDVREAGIQLAEGTGAEVVQVIGSTIILYKESNENKKIELPKK